MGTILYLLLPSVFVLGGELSVVFISSIQSKHPLSCQTSCSILLFGVCVIIGFVEETHEIKYEFTS